MAFGFSSDEGQPPSFATSPSAAFSAREQSCYRHAFAMADKDGSGQVGGMQAASFLSRSGIDRAVLKQIWDIADSSGRGWLGIEEFGIALRLVAHVQMGRAISADLAQEEPATLPQLTGVTPVPAGLCLGGSRQGAQQRGRSPAPGENRLAPTGRDLRKYGREFCRLTQNRSPGLLTAEEARNLFSRSGLGDDVLLQVWDVADHDRDAHLSWPEFVLAMHLIRRTLAGQPLPQGSSALPPELLGLLSSLEPAQAYASQPSRSPRAVSGGSGIFDTSRSRSPSPAPGTLHASPSRDEIRPPLGFASDAGGAPATGASFSGAFGGSLDGGDGFSTVEPEKRSSRASPTRRGRGERHSRGFDDPELPEPESRFSTSHTFGDVRPDDSDSFTAPTRSRPSRSGARLSEGRRNGSTDFPSSVAPGSQPVEHIEVLVECDRHLVQQLARDTDDLDEELSQLEELCRKEAQETSVELKECERVQDERQQLEQQLETSRRQLSDLKQEYQGLHIESVLLRRDTDHYTKEVAFLQHLFDEGMRNVQTLQQSVEYLEQSNQNLVAHTHSLEEARREVLQQAQVERELLRKEKQEAEQAMQALQALRSGSNGGFSNTGLQKAKEVSGVQRPRKSAGESAPPPWFAAGANLEEGAGPAEFGFEAAGRLPHGAKAKVSGGHPMVHHGV